MSSSALPLPTRLLRLGAGTVLAPGAVMSLGACSQTSVLSLELGQCITEATGEGQVSSVEVVDCGQPHASPSAESWAAGDRGVVCILTYEDGRTITGSLRGANR